MRTALHPPLLMLVGALVGSGGCGAEPAQHTTKLPVATSAPPAPAAAPSPARFRNPGGMWLPQQMTDQAAKLKELGLAIDPAQLTDPTSDILSSIVSLVGCSGSFISPDGLIATNHHCSTISLQYISTPSTNFLRDGFLAKTRADERNTGPQNRVLVTRAITDVTSKMREGLEAIADDRARHEEIAKRQHGIVATCEKGRPWLRCTVLPFYEGERWYLTEQLEIRDVRLVWAPPASVGNFGAEIDAAHWPRHTGDVALLRAYVGKDGQPADFSPDNVPYKPPHHLAIATAPLKEEDLVIAAGYPLRTNLLKTTAELDDALTWEYPRQQKLYEEYIPRLDEATKDDKGARIAAMALLRRWRKLLTTTKGLIDQVAKYRHSPTSERALREANGGEALDQIAAEIAKSAADREKNAQVEELLTLKLTALAEMIVHTAEQRAKPDAERETEFREREWPHLEQILTRMLASYNRTVDETLLRIALERIARLPAGERTPVFASIMGTKDTSPESIAKVAKELVESTTLTDEKRSLALLRTGTTASLQTNKDPMIRFALKLRALTKANDERIERFDGKMALLKPRYIEAVRELRKDPIAPDANGTLRVTFGTVRGYRPDADGPVAKPFTLLSEMVQRSKGAEPWEVPNPLLEAIQAKKDAPYVDPRLGGMPIDFISDLHTTNGSSGSATLNAKGELVGVSFDRNIEATASDWMFDPAVMRNIHVDIRYMLWLLDGPFDGHHLLKEMGITPKL